jgi:hypothetical protein
MRFLTLSTLVLAWAISAASCQKKPAAPTVDFATQIKPILESRCVTCHHSGALLGDLNLETRALALRQRPAGPFIVPGAPDQSRLYLVLTLPEGERKAMPPTGHRIPVEEVNLIKRWISEGAEWPEGDAGRVRSPVAEGDSPKEKRT